MELAQWEALASAVNIAVPVCRNAIIATVELCGVRWRNRNYFLHIAITIRMELAHLARADVEEVKDSDFAGRESQMRMSSGGNGIGQYDNAGRCQVDIIGPERRLIKRCKPIQKASGWAQLQGRVTKVAGAIIEAVASREI